MADPAVKVTALETRGPTSSPPPLTPAVLRPIEKLAAARGVATLVIDASDTAKPLFEALGYHAVHRNTIEIEGEYLGNTHMTKALAPKAAPGVRP